MTTANKTYGTKLCANKTCEKHFEARRVNMIYCSNECCREATNSKLIAKYHENKLVKIEDRVCSCGVKLSRYNKDESCHACQMRIESDKNKETLARLGIRYIDETL